VDKELLLHFIDGPGSGFTFIVLGFFALIAVLTIVRWANGYDAAMTAGREAERRDGLDQLRAQLAKVTFDQQQIMSKLEFREPAE
jgi:hypothetical protein